MTLEELVARPSRRLRPGLAPSWAGERGSVEQQLRAVEGKRRLRALVRVQVVLTEAVAAASGREVVERTIEAVATEEPVERAPRA